MKKKIRVEVPHRISGFFEIVDELNGKRIVEPERIGSRGAGFNLSALGKTEIKINELDKDQNHQADIFINEVQLNKKAETTNFILNYVQNLLKKPYEIEIRHKFELPVGCGYGASGSGALGTIYGLNHVFNLNLGIREIGRVAHIAEVVNRTGLGTVCGQLGGGLCVLKEPGYPCVYESIPFPNGLKIICGTFGMIHTKSILTSGDLAARIKEAGRRALQKLLNQEDILTFIKASIEFVEETELLTLLELDKTKELMDELNKLNILGASMNQLGRSIYAICKKKDEQKVLEIFDSFKPLIKIFKTTINTDGPRIIIH